MTLIDAYGLIALVADEPAAPEVETLLRSSTCGVVPANLAEAVDSCRRVHRIPPEDVRTAIEPLTLSGTLVVAMSDERTAWLAAHVRAEHYDRRRCPLSLADCFLLAHAIEADDAIATADPDLARVAELVGIRVAALRRR